MKPILTLFTFTIGQMLRDVKFWLMFAVLFLPCALFGLVRFLAPPLAAEKAWSVYHGMIHFCFIMGLVPMACMVLGTGLIGTEVESRTIIYLITRKMKRATVLAARFAAALLVLIVACCVAMVSLHLFLTINQDWAPSVFGVVDKWNLGQNLLTYVVMTAVCVAGYLAIFTFLGIAAARPLAWSLTYFVLFELILANTPSGVSRYSIARQVRNWAVNAIPDLSQINPQVFMADANGIWKVVVATAVAFVLSCIWIGRRELVPLKIARD